MNAHRLLAHFDAVVDTPGAVQRLRRFILDLAVRGKLVPQDPNDEPASELMNRISAEKDRLVKSGKSKKRRDVSPVSESELTFGLPSGWSPTRLAAVAICLDHLRKPINAAERTRRIAGKAQSELFPYFGATQQQGWIDDFIFDEDLVLLGEDGVPFLDPLRPKAYVVSGKSWVNNHAHVFRGIFISHLYLTHWLNAFDYSGRIVGATRAKLNQSRAIDIPIVLPPLAEQHRIVARVDELMALCDRLDAAIAEREASRDRFAVASFARLSAPEPDPVVVHSHAGFTIENFDRLTTRSDQIKTLRRTILNLAVRGALVAQNPDDEPASELLRRIEGKKVRMIERGEIRKPRDYRGPESTSAPFDIPSCWLWVKLGTVGAVVGGGTPDASDANNFTEPGTGFPWLTPADLGRRRKLFISHGARDLTEQGIQTSSARRVPAGTVLFTSRAPIGYVAIARSPISTNQGFKSVVPYIQECSQFIAVVLMAFAPEIDANAPGTTFREVSGKIVARYPFPLPPLAEQRRIVARVDELMTICDRLEEHLDTMEDSRRRLLDAMLHEALESDTGGGEEAPVPVGRGPNVGR